MTTESDSDHDMDTSKLDQAKLDETNSDMDISEESQSGSESDSESDDDFQTKLRVPKDGEVLDRAIVEAKEMTEARIANKTPPEDSPNPIDPRINDVNVAVMESVLDLLGKYGLNPAKLSDCQLENYIIYVIKNIPYQKNIRSGSVESQVSSDSHQSR